MARLFTPSESKYYLMALDAGTGSIRAVIFDLEGNQIAVGQAEWRHLAVPDVPGSMEFDLNKNWQLACECMRQALHNAGIAPEYIAAVSACSMREGIVLYNNEGTPIWACANVDARAAREVSELKELHNNTFENKVYRTTGQTLALSAIPRLLWLAHHRSDIYRQASTITMISDWLAYMLSGELAVDPSNAGTTGLLDLTEARLEEVLTAYKADIPLGMIREENDFRISVAGAQEKTALLRIGNDWCIPKGITPTTHIIKLPIGEIRQPNATLDLSQSVDNEYYCLLLAKELGLNVPDAEIIKAGNVRALAVERFDRRWNAERTVLLRLPQEDMCQTFGLPSSVKYESDGGPGIARIMAFLMGSSEALKDRYDFMKFQVFQWLIGATDGHAKNFSVFIQAGGSYRLTPFYDIISAFPVLGGAGIHISDLKLAMGLNASKGKKTAIDKIYPRHFLATAKVLKFPQVQMHEILSDFARMIPAALDNVKTSLPTDFPENVVTAVETNVLRLHRRLSREWY
ncbi:HipA domain-containing protein [Escherichia coli]|uniref:HipA domain-containing protein n=1 Tax=Escherichia coli TaxID=562 RepID=UPI003EE9BC26